MEKHLILIGEFPYFGKKVKVIKDA